MIDTSNGLKWKNSGIYLSQYIGKIATILKSTGFF